MSKTVNKWVICKFLSLYWIVRPPENWKISYEIFETFDEAVAYVHKMCETAAY